MLLKYKKHIMKQIYNGDYIYFIFGYTVIINNKKDIIQVYRLDLDCID